MTGEQIVPGYKLTDVGVIPSDWRVCFIEDICKKITTGKLDANAMTKDGNYPFFTCAKEHYWINEYAFDEEALLISGNGANVGYIHYYDGKFNAYQRTYVLTGFNADIQFSKLFMEKTLNSRLRTEVNAGNTPYIVMDTLAKMSIPIPPTLQEQRAIVSALSDVEALLAKLDQLIAKKRDLKQATMQQLLTGQTRLPRFSPTQTKFAKTALGIFPEDWRIYELSKLVEMSRGIRYGIVQPGRFDPTGRYMIRGQDYSEVNGWADASEIFRVSQEIEVRYQNARVKSGDLIMTIVGYCGHIEKIPDWLDGANLTQTTARIAIESGKADSDFCKYMLLGPVGRNQVASSMKGAAQPGLNCGDIARFLLPLPSIPEQSAIAAVLSDMDIEITALEDRRDKTRDLKQGMMQELLTGQIRLI